MEDIHLRIKKMADNPEVVSFTTNMTVIANMKDFPEFKLADVVAVDPPYAYMGTLCGKPIYADNDMSAVDNRIICNRNLLIDL